MGLALEVGFLTDMLQNDSEGAEYFQKTLKRLNEYLTSVKLSPHSEPSESRVFSCDMYGYSGLHYLRRLAAHLDLRSTLPPPGDDNASKDPVLLEYFELASEKKPRGILGGLFRKPGIQRHYDHLILHSDAEGYYIPQDFAKVLFPPEQFHIPGGMIGSSKRLELECQSLAATLKLPTDLNPDSDIVFNAMQSQGRGGTLWEQYGVESYVCLQLLKACKRSLETGAAIVFC